MKINIPNQITLARLFLAVVFFALLSLFSAAGLRDGDTQILKVCFVLFLVAALTDILDGFLARRWQQVTTFGRIVDPVVDKVMVCGAFVFFASHHFYDPQTHQNVTGVQSWMVIVILIRELLVSALRSHSEAQGQDFAASWVGKLKMFIQSATVCTVLLQLAWFEPAYAWARLLAVWVAVIVTALSIVSYARRAHAFLLSSEALGGTEPQDAGTASAPPTSDANRDNRGDRE
ncbi:MAG: CDP-diacylglycerol--glycerol-3-phosphate 3-phosphatidyltransferase [Planctomycetes bacterium]|nr:CDP-diacylglycerol--glycerol-3-phosphate 3-phosphatidyltransferase [Planctomycetota bacterium]